MTKKLIDSSIKEALELSSSALLHYIEQPQPLSAFAFALALFSNFPTFQLSNFLLSTF